MRIAGLEFSGVKSFGSGVNLPLGEISLVYGANSSGKSTILQTLLLLKQSLEVAYSHNPGLLEFRGKYVDLGGFRTLISNHDRQGKIVISLRLSGIKYSEDALFPAGPTRIRLTFGGDPESDRNVALREVAFEFGEGWVRFDWDLSSQEAKLASTESSALLAKQMRRLAEEARRRVPKAVPTLDDGDYLWLRRWMRSHPCQLIGWIPYWPPQASLGIGMAGRPAGGWRGSPRYELLTNIVFHWQNLAFRLAADLREALESLVYVGPLREFPRRMSMDSGDVSAGVGVRGESLVWHLSRNEDLVSEVNEAFGILDIPYSLRVEGLRSTNLADALGDVAVATLVDRNTDLVVSTADVGFGVSQVLPVVVQAMGNTQSLVLIEQPEIHVHPKMQSRIMDLLIHSMRANGNRFLIETHSEHLLLRAQRRIRQSRPTLNSDELSVFYVAQEGGVSSALNVELDENGDINVGWPGGFFDDRLEDLMECGD